MVLLLADLAWFLEDAWKCSDLSGPIITAARKPRPLPQVFLIGNCSYLEMSNLGAVPRLLLNEQSKEFGHRNQIQGNMCPLKATYPVKRLCSLRRLIARLLTSMCLGFSPRLSHLQWAARISDRGCSPQRLG